MRILTFDLETESLEPCDIEVPLQRLASSCPDRLSAVRWEKLLELVRLLKADGLYPEAWGQVFGNELYLFPANLANKVTVRFWMDWRDYGPVSEGLPVMHYRAQIERGTSRRSTDARAERPEEIKRLVWQAFGWLRE